MVVQQRMAAGIKALSLLPFLVVLAAAAPRSSPAQGPTPSLRQREPIEQADRGLQGAGWQPDGDALIDSLDRELSGNALTSLRSCSGTGVGFCRYGYRRGGERLEVITVPNRDGDGLVHHWSINPGADSASGSGT